MVLIKSLSVTAASLALFATPTAAAIKGVFAHYMVGGLLASTDHAKQDIADGLYNQFDAFALNLGSTEGWAVDAVTQLFDEADAQGFKLFFSLDMNQLAAADPNAYFGLVKQFSSRGSYYSVDGKPFLSTFNGHTISDSDWQGRFSSHGLSPYFVPDFDNTSGYPNNFFSTWPSVQGAMGWESAWPGTHDNVQNVSDTNDHSMIQQAHAAGKVYMMPWSTFQYKNLGQDYWYRKGELNYADRLVQILDNQPDYVELITWNDGGEGHYIGNVWSDALPSDAGGQKIHAITDAFPHGAWQRFLPSIIPAIKSGVTDPSKLFPAGDTPIIGAFWYRSILTTASCSGAKPDGADKAVDAVNYAFLLPENAFGLKVHVYSNGQEIGGSPFVANAGLNARSVEGLQTGKVSVKVVDPYGTTISEREGQISVTNDGGSLCNYNYAVEAL